MTSILLSERCWRAALVSLVALVAGCGSDDSSPASPTAGAEPANTPAPSPPAPSAPAVSTPAPSAVPETPPPAAAAPASGSEQMVEVDGIDPVAAAPASDGAATPATDPGTIEAGGDSKCAGQAGVLCDGFEGPAPGETGSAFAFEPANDSTAVVDTTKAYRGTQAVHIKTNGGGAFISETSSFTGTTAAANNETWGRIFIWFETDANPQSHDVFITLEDPASNAASAQLHLAGGSRGVLASQIRTNTDVYRPAIMAAQADPDSVKFPLETPRWQCWEWHTTPDNTLDFYIDGELYAPMSVKAADNWPFPIFKKLSLGFLQFGTTPATELWIDEVAVGSERVGCAN